mmetsp:Transcript_20597/g.58843  ORF Transcript_20597/g.58843 Transcript_20597/m.58843 type:complete len:456 (+) Transcript_20597:205-1572(+)
MSSGTRNCTTWGKTAQRERWAFCRAVTDRVTRLMASRPPGSRRLASCCRKTGCRTSLGGHVRWLSGWLVLMSTMMMCCSAGHTRLSSEVDTIAKASPIIYSTLLAGAGGSAGFSWAAAASAGSAAESLPVLVWPSVSLVRTFCMTACTVWLARWEASAMFSSGDFIGMPSKPKCCLAICRTFSSLSTPIMCTPHPQYEHKADRVDARMPAPRPSMVTRSLGCSLAVKADEGAVGSSSSDEGELAGDALSSSSHEGGRQARPTMMASWYLQVGWRKLNRNGWGASVVASSTCGSSDGCGCGCDDFFLREPRPPLRFGEVRRADGSSSVLVQTSYSTSDCTVPGLQANTICLAKDFQLIAGCAALASLRLRYRFVPSGSMRTSRTKMRPACLDITSATGVEVSVSLPRVMILGASSDVDGRTSSLKKGCSSALTSSMEGVWWDESHIPKVVTRSRLT